MAYLLGYGTAVEWLRQNTDASLLLQRYSLPPSSVESSRTRLQRHAQATADLTRPLHLVVTDRGSRRPSAEAICHLFAPSSYRFEAVRVDKGIYCSGPELAFIQMANLLDEERLLILGMELCGRYGIAANGRLFERTPTCSPDFLTNTAIALGRVRGKRKAANVAKHVLPGAASPMEAALALMLHEAPSKGGYGLRAPELNHPINVEGPAREQWDDDIITPDLLWEAEKLAIEYDSDTHHTASKRIARDALRRDVLVELGYRVVTVTTEHMSSPHQVDRIANIVARHLGQTIPEATDDQWAKRAAYQARIRRCASHPEELLGFSEFKTEDKRVWSVRNAPPSRVYRMDRHSSDHQGSS